MTFDPDASWRAEGYSEWPMAGSFIPSFSRVWFRSDTATHFFRVRVAEAHLNGMGVAHGGFISTMADIWLGYNVALRMPKRARFVTASLTVDYLKPARSGQCLESAIDRIKTGRRVCHAAGAILGDGEPVAAIRASFTVLDYGECQGQQPEV